MSAWKFLALGSACCAIANLSFAAPAPRPFEVYVEKVAESTGQSEKDIREKAIETLRQEGKYSEDDLHRIGRGGAAIDAGRQAEMVDLLKMSDSFHRRTGLGAVRNDAIAKEAGKAFEAIATEPSVIINDLRVGEPVIIETDGDSFRFASVEEILPSGKLAVRFWFNGGRGIVERSIIGKVSGAVDNIHVGEKVTLLTDDGGFVFAHVQGILSSGKFAVSVVDQSGFHHGDGIVDRDIIGKCSGTAGNIHVGERVLVKREGRGLDFADVIAIHRSGRFAVQFWDANGFRSGYRVVHRGLIGKKQ